jgi:hypothetical protein
VLRLLARAAAVFAVLALLAPAPADEDFTAEEEKWVRTLLSQLGANSARVRRGAEAALVQMGPDVLPVVVDGSGDLKGAAREGLKRVLAAMGLPVVRAAFERMRTEGKGERAKRAAALLTELGATVAPGTELKTPLKPDALQDPETAPLGLLEPVGLRLPWPRAGGPASLVSGAALEVDGDGDGKVETKLEPATSRVFEVGPAGGRRRVLVTSRRGRWLAAPADVLRGELKGRAVEFLDGDQDGAFAGERDHVRWGNGAFTPLAGPRRVLVEDSLATFEVRRAGEGWELVVLPEGRPDGTPEEAWRCLVAVNRLRQAVGLGPVGVDLVKCAACRKHAEWLRLNTGTPATQGLSAHHETPGTPGYSEDGAAAGSSSILANTSDPVDAVRLFAPTMLHATDLLGDPGSGFGVGCSSGGRGGWTAIWGSDGGARTDGTPLVVPAPGQVDVALRGSGEIPPPDDPPGWYDRPRGFPITALVGGRGLTRARLTLYEGGSSTPVPGRLWSPETPITKAQGGNDGGVFFMADVPLSPKSAYTAELTGEAGGKPVIWVWTFRTR